MHFPIDRYFDITERKFYKFDKSAFNYMYYKYLKDFM